MCCKLAVEAKLHFHINSDVMNSIVLITWVPEFLLLLFFFFFFFFFFARGTCGENSRRIDTNRKPHLKCLLHLGPVSCLTYSSKAVLWFSSERPMVCEDTGTMFWVASHARVLRACLRDEPKERLWEAMVL